MQRVSKSIDLKVETKNIKKFTIILIIFTPLYITVSYTHLVVTLLPLVNPRRRMIAKRREQLHAQPRVKSRIGTFLTFQLNVAELLITFYYYIGNATIT